MQVAQPLPRQLGSALGARAFLLLASWPTLEVPPKFGDTLPTPGDWHPYHYTLYNIKGLQRLKLQKGALVSFQKRNPTLEREGGKRMKAINDRRCTLECLAS